MKSVEEDPAPQPADGGLLTQPFGLAQQFSAPRFRVDTIALVDVGFIALLALFLSNSFLFSPGVPINLPTLNDQQNLVGVRAESVATVWNDRIVTVFGAYPLERMDTAFAKLRESRPEEDPTVLLLVDRSTPLESLSKIYESARRGGFARIQMAARLQPAPDAAP